MRKKDLEKEAEYKRLAAVAEERGYRIGAVRKALAEDHGVVVSDVKYRTVRGEHGATVLTGMGLTLGLTDLEKILNMKEK